jgi:hypothetical protein
MPDLLRAAGSRCGEAGDVEIVADAFELALVEAEGFGSGWSSPARDHIRSSAEERGEVEVGFVNQLSVERIAENFASAFDEDAGHSAFSKFPQDCPQRLSPED